MSTKQAYAVEGQARIIQVSRVDGYVLDDCPAFKAEWDEESQCFEEWLAQTDGGWRRTVSQDDVYQAIAFALGHGIERIELTGTFQI